MASSLSRVIQSLKKLPGIGNKSAERIAFHLLEMEKKEVEAFVQSLQDLQVKTIFCENCGLISEQSPCKICSSPKRDGSLICVVKNIQDALHIERSKSYRGQYHILKGLLSPLNHVYEKDLNIESLLVRVKKSSPSVHEIIFALEQSTEADVTIELIQEKIQSLVKLSQTSMASFISFSRMAVGIPMGTGLEFIDGGTLKQSLERRYPLPQK